MKPKNTELHFLALHGTFNHPNYCFLKEHKSCGNI